MQATFNFRGAQATVITHYTGGVMLEEFEGYADQCSGCESQGPNVNCPGCQKAKDESRLRRVAIIQYSPGAARSVASAMMQAAKEAGTR